MLLRLLRWNLSAPAPTTTLPGVGEVEAARVLRGAVREERKRVSALRADRFLFKKLLKLSFAKRPLYSPILHRGPPSLISQLIFPFFNEALALFVFRLRSFLI